ncbi:unnamed protein product [Dovyalis caffra]|uniref:Uncharacterized protein n=1 Tax=Dovyalis caffra TaxID=77055 RepID=A0AAV1R576_9ROSI|nr:unnamed protein product [Dovyalis caffra]
MEEDEEDDNCLDDWWAMADALAANDDDNKLENNNNDNNPCLELKSSPEHEPIVQFDCNSCNTGSYHENLMQGRRVPL